MSNLVQDLIEASEKLVALYQEKCAEVEQLKLQIQAYEQGAESKSQMRRMAIQLEEKLNKK